MTIQSIPRRVSVLVLIALFSVFALTVSTHATSDYDYGWDPHPAWGSVSVYGFNITSSYATTHHYVSLQNMSDRRDISCPYAFQTQVLQQPQFTTRSEGRIKVRRASYEGLGGWNYLSFAGLKPGEWYTLSAYTRVAIGNTTIKASASVDFWHE